MINSRVAVTLDTPVWRDGQENVCEEDEASRCQIFFMLSRPDICVCGNKVGGNLSMKGDRYLEGETPLI